MRDKIKIDPIVSREQLFAIRPWLESFNHQPITNPIGRYHSFAKGDRLLAVTQQTQLNTLVPAVNPNVCTPRETSEIVECFHHWEANQDAGLVTVVPQESHMHVHMDKLGYKPYAVLYKPKSP